MNKYKFFISLVFSFTIILIGGFLFIYKATPGQNPDASLVSSVAEKLELKKQEILHKITLKKDSDSKKTTPNQITKARMQTAFFELYKNIDFFESENLEKAVFEELLMDSNNLDFSVEILLDNKKTVLQFGDKQAEMRAYSVKFLSYAASTGNIEPLEVVIRSLYTQMKKNGETINGQYLDLEESVFALCQNLGVSSPEVSIKEVFERFNIVDNQLLSSNERATLQAFAAGVSIGFKDKMPWSSINKFLIENFPYSL